MHQQQPNSTSSSSLIPSMLMTSRNIMNDCEKAGPLPGPKFQEYRVGFRIQNSRNIGSGYGSEIPRILDPVPGPKFQEYWVRFRMKNFEHIRVQNFKKSSPVPDSKISRISSPRVRFRVRNFKNIGLGSESNVLGISGQFPGPKFQEYRVGFRILNSKNIGSGYES
uniref:Uncharacterized protein n=1 Tax=Romanomermis culicivorax TaxID=13658 RepID=A0A915L1P7_ROMCU